MTFTETIKTAKTVWAEMTKEQKGTLLFCDVVSQVAKGNITDAKKEGFEIKRETKKALLLEENGKTFWIQKRWMRADGTLTPKGEESRAAATDSADFSQTKKTKCVSVRVKGVIATTEKAMLLEAFDGSECWIPKKADFGRDDDVLKSNAMWIAEWALKGKRFQYSNKKTAWIA